MQLLDITNTGKDYEYRWPNGDSELYGFWIEYRAASQRAQHTIRIGFGTRKVYGQDRKRVVVWIDKHPHAEFIGADDFDASGDVLSEVKVPGKKGERIARYPKEAVPARYSMFPVAGLLTRVSGPAVHSAWAVVANVSDHRTMAALAALRLTERERPRSEAT